MGADGKTVCGMAEYIDREAAYALAKKICDAFRAGEYSPVEMPYKILDWIDDIPAADVRPVVRGRWITKKDSCGRNYTVCSACETEIQWRSEHGVLLHVVMTAAPYCPNCGADMREENNG